MATLMISPPVARAADDVRRGLMSWRIWWLMGLNDIRQRYARSRFGQFWLTLSMAIFIGSTGVVFALLFNQPFATYVPYIAVNVVVWHLISGIFGDSATVFTQSENVLRQEALPKTVFVLRLLLRNLAIFSHNIVIIPLVWLALATAPSWTVLLLPVGLALILAAGFFATLLLGILCTRFRDLPQIVQHILQIGFFVTPVMWPAGQIKQTWIVDYNPFAALLHVAAEPLRGSVPSGWTYLVALGTIAVLAAVSVPLFVRFRARIVYWL